MTMTIIVEFNKNNQSVVISMMSYERNSITSKYHKRQAGLLPVTGQPPKVY